MGSYHMVFNIMCVAHNQPARREYRCSMCKCSAIAYPRKRGPMGGAPYIGPKLGDGPIFEVSVSRLSSKESPGKLPYFLVIRRISLISAYSLLSACYFVGLSTCY